MKNRYLFFTLFFIGVFLTDCEKDVPYEDYCSPVFPLCNDDFPIEYLYSTINLPKIQGKILSGSFDHYNINSPTTWKPEFSLLYGSGSSFFNVIANTNEISLNGSILDSKNVLDGSPFSYNIPTEYYGNSFPSCFVLRYSDGSSTVEGHFFARGWGSTPTEYKKEGYRSYYINGSFIENIGRLCLS